MQLIDPDRLSFEQMDTTVRQRLNRPLTSDPERLSEGPIDIHSDGSSPYLPCNGSTTERRRRLIVNIDFAFGKQAEIILVCICFSVNCYFDLLVILLWLHPLYQYCQQISKAPT